MSFEPEFITLDDVLDLHELQLKRYGGSEGIRDLKLLESAVMTPQASFGGEFVHTNIFEMAAAYAPARILVALPNGTEILLF